jgi:hypothetical protein
MSQTRYLFSIRSLEDNAQRFTLRWNTTPNWWEIGYELVYIVKYSNFPDGIGVNILSKLFIYSSYTLYPTALSFVIYK